MSIEEDPSLDAMMDARAKHLMSVAAEEGADILHENLSSGSHGSGVHYARLPNRSSAEGEMPVMQSGALSEGVGTRDGTGTGSQVVINDKLGKLLGLEFSPPSTNPNQPGKSKRHSGGRAPMWETMTDDRTGQAMKAVMEDA